MGLEDVQSGIIWLATAWYYTSKHNMPVLEIRLHRQAMSMVVYQQEDNVQ